MRILYLGLDPSRYQTEGEITHLPLIHIVPKPFLEVAHLFEKLKNYTHVLFTSRSAIPPYVEYAFKSGYLLSHLQEKRYLVIGEATSQALLEYQLTPHAIATLPTAEGILPLLDSQQVASLFFPHSSLSRPLLKTELISREIPHLSFPLYDTQFHKPPLPPLELFEEIVFTSPSTVKAFYQCTQNLPPLSKCRAIGPITKKSLEYFWALPYG